MQEFLPFATFCTVIGYRVGTANVAGVAVAILSGGPGAVFWMLVTSILDTAISYAECSLGQCYKIKQDGEYRGWSILLYRKRIRNQAACGRICIVNIYLCPRFLQ